MSDRHDEGLFHPTKKTYDDSFTVTLLEQYKMYVQTVENVSARRVTTSRYLLTLSAAFVALYGLQLPILNEGYWVLIVPVTGMFVALLWYKIIESHHDLNRVKFEIIHEIEQHLPARLFTHEWHIARKGDDKHYTKITDIERWIPFLFIGLHVVLIINLIWQMFI